MSGIAKIENGNAVAWSPIHDGDRCVPFFGADPIPDPLPDGYQFAESLEAALSPAQHKLAEVQAWYASAIAAGYDTGLGFALVLAEQDQRILFDYQQRLLRQITLREITEAAARPIKGTDGHWHLATVEQLIAAVDGGAAYIEQLNGQYAGYELRIGSGDLDFTPGAE